MYSTSVYYYKPRHVVVYYSGTSARRYQIVYAKNLRLNKGVDNVLQFQFLNQEQKAVDLTGKELTFRLISYDGTKVLLEKAVNILLPLTGITELTTTASEIEDVDPQLCSYSIEVTDGSMNYPVFVNSEATARGTIQVVDSVLPSFVPAFDLTIPDHPTPNNSTETYYSSTLSTYENPILTMQLFYDNFSGIVQIQGSTVPDSSWYDIGDPYEYLDFNSSEGTTIDGFHPYVRVKFVSTQGNVSQILAR